MLSYFKNPDSLLSKLSNLPFIQRIILFVIVMSLGWSYTIFQMIQQYQQIRQIEEMLVYEKQDLQHNQQIFERLKQHITQSALTPTLTSQMTKINQYIHQHSHKIVLQSTEWTFHSFPLLNLQFQSYFADFHNFLTTLLTQYPQLKLSKLQLLKIANIEGVSVQVDILLQLQPIEE